MGGPMTPGPADRGAPPAVASPLRPEVPNGVRWGWTCRQKVERAGGNNQGQIRQPTQSARVHGQES